LLDFWPEDAALGRPARPAPNRDGANSTNLSGDGIPFSGDLEKDKRLVVSRYVSKAIQRNHVVILKDNGRGLQNTEFRTVHQILAHCSRHQSDSSPTQFGWKDATHLTRFVRFSLVTATLPFVLSGNSSVMTAVADVEVGDFQALLSTGFDASLRLENRGGPFVLATGNPKLSDLFAGSLAETLPLECPLLGARYSEPASQTAYAFIILPLALGEVRRSSYGFLLEEPQVLQALQARLFRAQNQPGQAE
jgi:hypothetical protein